MLSTLDPGRMHGQSSLQHNTLHIGSIAACTSPGHFITLGRRAPTYIHSSQGHLSTRVPQKNALGLLDTCRSAWQKMPEIPGRCEDSWSGGEGLWAVCTNTGHLAQQSRAAVGLASQLLKKPCMECLAEGVRDFLTVLEWR